VNQLARKRELDVQRLIKAGEALEQAHRQAISGEDVTGFEAARRDEDAAIRRLLDAAEELGSASGTTLERVGKTLRAAAATPEGRLLVKQGRLDEDLEPPGFEALAELAMRAPRARRPRAATGRDEPAPQRRQLETLRRRKQAADERSKGAADEARELERQAREADQVAKKAQRAAASARKRADVAAAQAQQLEDELAELRRRQR
jgi:hypothetical protein